MASRTIIIRTDDIDGSEGAETVSFGLDDVTYAIDLTADNAQKLRDALAEYIQHGRKVSGRRTRAARGSRGRGGASIDRSQIAVMRAWAQNNGYQVSDRGRLPAAVVEAYNAAH